MNIREEINTLLKKRLAEQEVHEKKREQLKSRIRDFLIPLNGIVTCCAYDEFPEEKITVRECLDNFTVEARRGDDARLLCRVYWSSVKHAYSIYSGAGILTEGLNEQEVVREVAQIVLGARWDNNLSDFV